MASTARKGKKVETHAFTLPDSLPCSEVDIPILLKRKAYAKWENILLEREAHLKEIEEFNRRGKETIPKAPFLKTETDYIQTEVFKLLIPALEETLTKANIWEALHAQKCFFNGIDHIAQLLWNNNPRYPIRKADNLHVFNMPWTRKILKDTPRPLYPKSWLWPEEYAANLIQKTVRRYFVQRLEDVQEMREFWRKLKHERNNPDIGGNYFLAKDFASVHPQLPTPKPPSKSAISKKGKPK